METKHEFKVGDRVAILNSTLGGGSYFVEGYATILEALEGPDYYRVQFDPQEGQEEGEIYCRHVHLEAQADPESYAKALNAHLRSDDE